MDSKITIRPATPEDFPEIVALHNLHNEHAPTTPEAFRATRATYPEKARHDLDVMLSGDHIVAYGYLEDNFWCKAEHQWGIGAYSRRDSAEKIRTEAMLHYQESKAPEIGARELLADTRTDRPWELELYRRLGYEERQRFPQSELILAEFDPAPFRAKVDQAKAAGLEILPISTYCARFPTDWKQRLHAFEEEVKHDIPWEDGFDETTFEEFLKQVENPLLWKPDGRFVALDADTLAGITELEVNPVRPDVGNTGLTAVRRPYRRTGLATALKVTSLEWARSKGLRVLETNNEEKNPMFQLNLALGFRDVWFWVALKKRLSEIEPASDPLNTD